MTATEVFTRVFVGGINDAEPFRNLMVRRRPILLLSVRDDGCPHEECVQIPIIVDNTIPPEEPIHASVEQLEKAAVLIEQAWKKNVPVFVHCTMGAERSPLTVAYWLVTRHGFTWSDAYTMLMVKRQEVFNRSDWLPWEIRNGKPYESHD